MQLPAQRLLHARTPEQAHEVGERLFHPHRLTLRGASADFGLAAAATRVGPFTVGTLSYSRPVRIDTGPYVTAYQVNVPLTGSFRTSSAGQRVVAAPHRGAIYRPDVATAFSGWEEPCTMLGIKIERAHLERAARSLFGGDSDAPIAFRLPLDLASAAGEAWLASLRRLLVVGRQSERYGPVVAGRVVGDVTRGLLLAAEHPLSARGNGRVAGPSSLRLALELMEGAPDEGLNLEAVAEYAGVSGRALQLRFRRELETTPIAYLRGVRLDRARERLERATPGEATVSSVARGLGFAHLGRFAGDYARRHGCRPSATLAEGTA